MSAVQRFKFDQNFDAALQAEQAPAPDAVEPEATPEPTVTQSELEAAVQAAHNDGYAKGSEEARAAATTEFATSIERARAETLEQIRVLLADVASAQAELRGRFEHDAIQVACAIAKKTVPEMLQRAAVDTIEAMVKEVLPRLLEEPRIAVRVADGVLDGITERLDAQKANSGFEGEFIVVADPELESANCRIEWADGGVDVCSDRVWAEIDAVVGEFLGAAADAPAPEDTPAPPQNPDGNPAAEEPPAMPAEDTNRDA